MVSYSLRHWFRHFLSLFTIIYIPSFANVKFHLKCQSKEQPRSQLTEEAPRITKKQLRSLIRYINSFLITKQHKYYELLPSIQWGTKKINTHICFFWKVDTNCSNLITTCQKMHKILKFGRCIKGLRKKFRKNKETT